MCNMGWIYFKKKFASVNQTRKRVHLLYTNGWQK
jgi:hypothetical protein